jgi:hypothetical protein
MLRAPESGVVIHDASECYRRHRARSSATSDERPAVHAGRGSITQRIFPSGARTNSLKWASFAAGR